MDNVFGFGDVLGKVVQFDGTHFFSLSVPISNEFHIAPDKCLLRAKFPVKVFMLFLF